MRDAFIARLLELAQADPNIVLITGDLGFCVLDEFRATLPKQFVNAGVAEQNMTGLAVGLALSGKTVFTYSIGNFSTLRCLEQIRNDACYHEVNVNVVAVGGGFSYGPLGFSHHATEDLPILRALPGVTVVAPGDCWEARQATELLCRTPGVGYLRLDKMPAPETTADGDFALGKIRCVREGSDAAVVAIGGVLGEALEAAELLAREHALSCRVLSAHTLKPFDTQTVLAAVRETDTVVTVEEGTVLGGLAGAVSEACLEAGVLPRRFVRLGLRDQYATEVGRQPYLRDRHGVSARHIADAVRAART